jgi:hypothetical protein
MIAGPFSRRLIWQNEPVLLIIAEAIFDLSASDGVIYGGAGDG